MPTSNTPELSQEAWEAWRANAVTERVFRVLAAHSKALEAQWKDRAFSNPEQALTLPMQVVRAGAQAMSDLSCLTLETFRKYEQTDGR